MSNRNTAETVFTGDAASLVAAYQQIREENRKRDEDLRKLKQASREAHQEEQQGLREATRMYREVQSPLEGYRDRVREIEKAYEAGNIDQETFNRQLRLQRDLLEQNTTSANSLATAVKGFVAGFLGMAGIQRILAAVREEIDNLRQRQEGAAGTQLRVAEAERAALKSFGPERGVELKAMAQRVQKDTGSDYIAILDTISQTASSQGTKLGDKEVEDAVTVAAQLSPGNAAEMKAGAAAIISQMREFGGGARQVAGQQMAANVLAPIGTSEAFSNNIVPGAGNLRKMGLTAEQSYGVLAAAGNAVDDKTGQTTANAMNNFFMQLKTKLPQYDNPFDALAFIRSDEGSKVRKKLLGPMEKDAVNAGDNLGLTGEKKFLPFMMDLLQAKSNMAQESVTESIASIPSLEQAAVQLERDLNAINREPNQLTAALNRRLAAATQHRELVNVEEGRAHIAREGMLNFLKASGVSKVGQDFASAKFELGTEFGTRGNEIEFLEQEFERQASELRTPKHMTLMGLEGMATPATIIQPSQQNLRDAQGLHEFAMELRSIKEAIEIQTAENQRLHEKPRPVEVQNFPTRNPAESQSR